MLPAISPGLMVPCLILSTGVMEPIRSDKRILKLPRGDVESTAPGPQDPLVLCACLLPTAPPAHRGLCWAPDPPLLCLCAGAGLCWGCTSWG